MKYVAPVAEFVSVEAVSVLMTSNKPFIPGVTCPNETPEEEI